MKEFIEKFNELINLNEDTKYYYHITGKGNSNYIMEEGLYLKENKKETTKIEITKELIEDPYMFIQEEVATKMRGSEEMVIISCQTEETEYLIEDNSNNKQNQYLLDYQYSVPSKFIVGYIDMQNFEIHTNPNSYNSPQI